jgi:hypothetical protein
MDTRRWNLQKISTVVDDLHSATLPCGIDTCQNRRWSKSLVVLREGGSSSVRRLFEGSGG